MSPFRRHAPEGPGYAFHRESVRGFAVDRAGRVLPLEASGDEAVARVRLDETQVAIELRAATLSSAVAQILRQWLLTLLGDERPILVLDVKRARVSYWRSAIDVMEFVTSLLGEASLKPAPLDDTLLLIAGAGGVSQLGGRSSDREAGRLIRAGDRIAFLPEADRLTVLAKAGISADVLANACAWLSAQGPRTIRLRVWLGQGWINEALACGIAAAERLRQLVRLDGFEAPLPSYVGRRVRAEELPAEEFRRLAPLLALYGATLDDAAVSGLLRGGFGDWLCVTGVREGHGRYIVHAPGPDYVGPAWHAKASGSRLVDQPDSAYGRNVNDRIVAASQGNGPHVEYVQAGIREAHDDHPLGDTRLTKYVRVAVPCHRDGENVVLSYTILRRWDQPAAA